MFVGVILFVEISVSLIYCLIFRDLVLLFKFLFYVFDLGWREILCI